MSPDTFPPGRVVKVNGRARDTFLADPDFVYVGRRFAGFQGSIFGNPFSSREYGRQNAIGLFRSWLVECLMGETSGRSDFNRMVRHLHELDGKILGCWCCDWDGETFPAPQVCHAVVLNLAVRGLLVDPSQCNGQVPGNLRATWNRRKEALNANLA